MTGNRPYHSDASPAERRAVVENERRVHKNSYFSHAHPDEGGRFAAINKSTVTGSTPVPQYPPQPTSSPWASAAVGQEPPLGFSVDEMQPVGEPHEIELSLREMRCEAGSPPASSPDSPTRRGPRSTRLTPSDVSSRPRRPSRKND
jgi:hypothetical protein